MVKQVADLKANERDKPTEARSEFVNRLIRYGRLARDRVLLRQPEAIGAFPFELRANTLFWERWLNIRTRGSQTEHNGEAYRYEPAQYYVIRRIFDQLRLAPHDVVVDVGSGKGRVVCMAAHLPIKKSIGVEYSSELNRIAESNKQRMRGQIAPIEIWEGWAQDYRYDDATVVMLFNPFGERIMRQLMEVLQQSMQRRPRPLRLVYTAPTCQHVFEEQSWLRKTAEWPLELFPGFILGRGQDVAVTFWEARPQHVAD